MRHFPLVLACLLACLLVSCVRSHIGERIRQGDELRLGVDVNHPIGKRVLIVSNGRNLRHFVQAREVSYRVKTPFLTCSEGSFAQVMGLNSGEFLEAMDVQPTGKVRNVECEGYLILKPVRLVDSLPRSSTPDLLVHSPNNMAVRAKNLGSFGYKKKAGIWRRIAAAPFDYLIDPAISLIGTTLSGTAQTAYTVLYSYPRWVLVGED